MPASLLDRLHDELRVEGRSHRLVMSQIMPIFMQYRTFRPFIVHSTHLPLELEDMGFQPHFRVVWRDTKVVSGSMANLKNLNFVCFSGQKRLAFLNSVGDVWIAKGTQDLSVAADLPVATSPRAPPMARQWRFARLPIGER